MNQEGNIIELKKVRKVYLNGHEPNEVLHTVDVEIKEGEVAVLLGPSGSGKSTLLNLMSGLDRPTYGEIISSNINIAALTDKELTNFRKNNVGFVFQSYNLLSNLTAIENAEVGYFLQDDKEKRLDLKELFKVIDLEEHTDKFIHQLSGGQQQRVSLARAVAKNPKLLFADEPTGALDEEMGKNVLNLFMEINKKYNTTIIMVTHNPSIAQMAHRVIKVKNGNIEKIELTKNRITDAKDINW